MIRIGLLMRKFSQGTSARKGNCWVKRIFTHLKTSRILSLKRIPFWSMQFADIFTANNPTHPESLNAEQCDPMISYKNSNHR